MTGLDVIRLAHRHRAWANARLLAASRTLTSEQLNQACAIGQGSVWKSLVHMFAAEFVWLETLIGNEQAVAPGDLPGRLPGNQLGAGAMTTFAELEVNWRALEERWEAYLDLVLEDSLEKPVARVSTSSGFGMRLVTKEVEVHLHVCTHAHYTATQTINMLKQAECEKLPDLMMISMARQV